MSRQLIVPASGAPRTAPERAASSAHRLSSRNRLTFRRGALSGAHPGWTAGAQQGAWGPVTPGGFMKVKNIVTEPHAPGIVIVTSGDILFVGRESHPRAGPP